jgi:hypothetical protein
MLLAKLTVAACIFAAAGFAEQTRSATVDGSKNPELISDNEAYKMMFLTLSDSKDSLSRGARQNYLSSSGLTGVEVDIVLDASNQFAIYANSAARQYKIIKAQRNAGTISQSELSAQIRTTYDATEDHLKSVISSLESELGSNASAKLLNFVRTKVKRTMTAVDPLK